MRSRVAAPWLALAILVTPTEAQIPDKFTNLKILAKDMSKQELVSKMRGFASGLGVRCNHCHVGGTASDLTGMDFASDDKREKRVARGMLAMVDEINGKMIKKAGIENPVTVGCVTCHHGVTRPETLPEILKRAVAAGGVDALKTEYRSLREKYYGSASYDFKARSLNEVAEWLSEENKGNVAIAVMQFNIEQNPGDAYCYNLLGRLQMDAGDNATAMASFTKAIELDPNDKWSARLLEKLQAESQAQPPK